VNLIVVEPEEFIAPDLVRLAGRRYRHWREVLRGRVGGDCKVGLLNGPIGRGCAVAEDADAVTLRVVWTQEAPPPSALSLILALPRPKTLRKVLYAAVGFGVGEIIFLNAWKVEKSYWKSPALVGTELAGEIRLALEQAVDTREPRIGFRPLFKPFVEDELPGRLAAAPGIVAHPGSAEVCPAGEAAAWVRTLILGPEGGFTDYEIGALQAAGACPVRLGARILRTEVALAALLGRLTL